MGKNSFWSDKKLSWKAKGLLSYLIHCKKTANTKELIEISKDQITSVYSGLNELKESGYLEQYPIRNELGRYKAYENKAVSKKE